MTALTDQIRSYLAAARAAKYFLTQVTHDLEHAFGLNGTEAGRVVVADLEEQI